MKDRFKQIRKALNLSQTEMGELLGKGLRAIQHYEKGERSIDNTVIILLEKAYNVNPIWLRTGEGQMFIKKEEKNNRYEFLNRMLDDFSDEELAEIIKTTQAMVDKKNNKIENAG